MIATAFQSLTEFRSVMDRVFQMMSDDPEMGPRLRDADVPQRFEFSDVDLVVQRPRRPREDEAGNLHWEWSDDVDWEPRVRMSMSARRSPTATSRARRTSRWRSRGAGSGPAGDVKAALSLIPITKPIYARYRAGRRADYPHLAV